MLSIEDVRALRGFDEIEGARGESDAQISAQQRERIGGADPVRRTDGAPPALLLRILEGHEDAPSDEEMIAAIDAFRAIDGAIARTENMIRAAANCARMMLFSLARRGELRIVRARPRSHDASASAPAPRAGGAPMRVADRARDAISRTRALRIEVAAIAENLPVNATYTPASRDVLDRDVSDQGDAVAELEGELLGARADRSDAGETDFADANAPCPAVAAAAEAIRIERQLVPLIAELKKIEAAAAAIIAQCMAFSS
jgi:hypothetical protein